MNGIIKESIDKIVLKKGVWISKDIGIKSF